MEKITDQALRQLLASKGQGPAVTVYAPMHASSAPPLMTENQIRLKNLIRDATDLIAKEAGSTTQTEDTLRTWYEQTAENMNFWESQTEGLLICAQGDMIRTFQLPMDTEEYVAVDDSFHLAPVLGLLHDAHQFYVLAIAQHGPKLFKGDMYDLQPAGIELPHNLAESLHIDTEETTIKSQSSVSAGGSSVRTHAFNGRGGERDTSEEDRLHFMRMIDRAVMEKADRLLPVVLAGTDSELAEYRSISKLPHLMRGTIGGNVVNTRTDVLLEQAKRLIQDELIVPRRAEAIEQYMRLLGSTANRTADNSEAISEAAKAGRVRTFLIAMSRFTADTVHTGTDSVQRITFPAGLKQAVNRLALAVHNTSGDVIIVDESQMPDNRQMAAVFRY